AMDYPQYEVHYEENNMFFNSDYPWMHASLDGELIERVYPEDGGEVMIRRGILEIKTTNILQTMQKEKWNDRIPDNYYIQILHYLAVTGWDFVILKAQLKSEYRFGVMLTTRHYRIDREDVQEDIDYLIEAERRFWNCVVTGTRPNLILPVI
ncbi:MAG: YqaJ viral recombinase family protein, partial [Clostridium sp.]|nr:YqaJ viral recombinase family protein [Clostridium sp.]